MAKRIFITRKIADAGIKILRKRGYRITVNPNDSVSTQKQIIQHLKKVPYDAVLTVLTDRVDAAVFKAAPTVKIYANCAAGYDNINAVEARKRGIVVTNAPSVLAAQSVAEHALALMFALARRIVEADKFVRQGKYKGWSPTIFIGAGLAGLPAGKAGKTLGVVGAGRIGERVIRYSKKLGFKIIYNDVIRNRKVEKKYGTTYYHSIEKLLKEANIVSLHVPLLASTRHLINKRRLLLMKPTSFLINTSRGAVIDERALEWALRKKVIGGAALDVFEFEPRITPGLAKLDNVILTPHIASAAKEARDQMAELAARNIIDFFDGKTPRNLVN